MTDKDRRTVNLMMGTADKLHQVRVILTDQIRATERQHGIVQIRDDVPSLNATVSYLCDYWLQHQPTSNKGA
jgi:hypothetical protein